MRPISWYKNKHIAMESILFSFRWIALHCSFVWFQFQAQALFKWKTTAHGIHSFNFGCFVFNSMSNRNQHFDRIIRLWNLFAYEARSRIDKRNKRHGTECVCVRLKRVEIVRAFRIATRLTLFTVNVTSFSSTHSLPFVQLFVFLFSYMHWIVYNENTWVSTIPWTVVN